MKEPCKVIDNFLSIEDLELLSEYVDNNGSAQSRYKSKDINLSIHPTIYLSIYRCIHIYAYFCVLTHRVVRAGYPQGWSRTVWVVPSLKLHSKPKKVHAHRHT